MQHIYTSHERKAQETGAIIAEQLGAIAISVPDLEETRRNAGFIANREAFKQ